MRGRTCKILFFLDFLPCSVRSIFGVTRNTRWSFLTKNSVRSSQYFEINFVKKKSRNQQLSYT